MEERKWTCSKITLAAEEEKRKITEQELQLREQELQVANNRDRIDMHSNLYPIHSFSEKENIDAYLRGFERFAEAQKWPNI